MLEWLFVFNLAHALEAEAPTPAPELAEDIQSARATISEAERRQREMLSQLFSINQRIKEISKRRSALNEKLMRSDAAARALAQDLQVLEARSDFHQDMLNDRLRSLYQGRHRSSIQWLFSARTPVELERNHRFLKRMIDSDHRQLKEYVAGVKDLQRKRAQLKTTVAELASTQREVEVQEKDLVKEMREKSRVISELDSSKSKRLTELKTLRQLGENSTLPGYAFFERKGTLKPPIEGRLAREYGTYVDPQFRFRLMHKGLFYAASRGSEVRAVFDGVVVLATKLPGYGATVILDHGDNYYSVYALNAQVKVKEGANVAEGQLVAVSGDGSPLFGPGLHFEIRHFTDAIDPRQWIKEPVIKTADSH